VQQRRIRFGSAASAAGPFAFSAAICKLAEIEAPGAEIVATVTIPNVSDPGPFAPAS